MESETLPFDNFWSWIQGHANCILRAGTPDAVLYDDEEFHWHFGSEGPEMRLVQVVQGKRLIGELLISPDPVTYVQGMQGEVEGEFVFELISETAKDRSSLYFFVLSHGFEDGQGPADRRVH